MSSVRLTNYLRRKMEKVLKTSVESQLEDVKKTNQGKWKYFPPNRAGVLRRLGVLGLLRRANFGSIRHTKGG